MTNEGDTDSTATTRCNAALVVSIDFEKWPELLAKAKDLGAKIFYRTTAAPWIRLEIVRTERGRE